ncbi:6-hydroxymethylpterin diphosphokinase MptE-like protein [Lysinibacillus irui]|uniref:motility associated factor glycosyltransferase family protein n=1 Tax=Lysinibacillus irui TaxID=2998077 RepID=UPI003D294B92
MQEFLIEQVDSRHSKPALKVNDFFVHSKYDPIIEAERIASLNYEIHHTHIVFGYGLGYIVDALLGKVHSEKIIIIDPLIEKGILDIESRHKNTEQIIYWGNNQVNTLAFTISRIASGLDLKIKIICAPNYDKLFMKEYYELLKYISEFQNKTIVNQNTVVIFSEQWQSNLAQNILPIIQDETLSVLHNKFDLPIVVASGGPSLTKQLELLKQIKEHVIIIAAGSTINSLLAARIEPDFVISIDGGEPNYNHFKELRIENARLIYSVFNHPGVRKSFEKRAFVFAETSQLPITKYLYEKFDIDLPLITGGGTVAHFSLSIAQLFNSGPIAMIGQDLAYTDNLSHAANNKHSENIDSSDPNLVWTDGYYGEKVLTSRVFLSMKVTFEEMLRFQKPSVPLFNCTEGGVKLAGYKQIPFKEFVDIYVDKNVVKDLGEIDGEKYSRKTKEELLIILDEEIKILDILDRRLLEALNLLEKNDSKTSFNKKILKKLDKIDTQIESLTKDIQIHFLVNPIVIEIGNCFLEKPNETPEETYERVYKQTKTLYTRLLAAIKLSKQNVRAISQLLNNKKENI